MKQIYFLFVLFLAFGCKKANRTESAIFSSEDWKKEVITMQNELIALAKNPSSNCIKNIVVEHETIADDFSNSFTQQVEKCNYKNGYSIVKADLRGYGWSEKVTYYLKNNKVFWGESAGASESYAYEHIIIFDQNENIISLEIKNRDLSSDEDLKLDTSIGAEEKQLISEGIIETYQKVSKMAQ